MKEKFGFIILLLIQVNSIYGQSPYQVKNVKIDFVWSTGISKGTKTLIIADSGWLVKQLGTEYDDTSVNFSNLGAPKGFKITRSVIHSLIIQNRDSVISIDLDSMTGSLSPNMNRDVQSFMSAFKKIGEQSFLGRSCDILEIPGLGKMLMWKDICVNKILDIADVKNIYEYATSIDTDYVIKSDEFKIPNGIKLLQ